MVLLTIELSCDLLFQKPVVMKLEEDVMGDIRVQWSCRSAKDVKTDIEPVVHGSMYSVVLVTELLWRAILNKRSCLGRGTIFVRA